LAWCLRSTAGLRGTMMIRISSRSRLVAAASPLALAMVMASSPARAQDAQPGITGAASAATAAQPADQGANPTPQSDQASSNIVVTGFRASLQNAINKKKKADQIDRKSTRLNSSHDQISYAVFCLKKKKKK